MSGGHLCEAEAPTEAEAENPSTPVGVCTMNFAGGHRDPSLQRQ